MRLSVVAVAEANRVIAARASAIPMPMLAAPSIS
jgi:hypothetical protein